MSTNEHGLIAIYGFRRSLQTLGLKRIDVSTF